MDVDSTKVVSTDKDAQRNSDSLIEQNCEISKPEYGQRARNSCMGFKYFERDLTVFSEEEGIYK